MPIKMSFFFNQQEIALHAHEMQFPVG